MSRDEVERLVTEFGQEYTGEASESRLFHWLQQAGSAELWPRFRALLVERGIWEPAEAREQKLTVERAASASGYREAAAATTYSIVSKMKGWEVWAYMATVVLWGFIALRSDVLDNVLNAFMFGPVGLIVFARIWRYLRPLRVSVAGSMLRAIRGNKTIVEIPADSIAYLDVAHNHTVEVLEARRISRVGRFVELTWSGKPKKVVVARLKDGGLVLLSDVVDAASAHGGCRALEEALGLVPTSELLVRVDETETEEMSVGQPADRETSVA